MSGHCWFIAGKDNKPEKNTPGGGDIWAVETGRAVCELPANGIVSAWDIMFAFHAELTCRTLAAAGVIENTAQLLDKDSEVTERYLQFVRHTVLMIGALALEARLDETSALANRLIRDWGSGTTYGETLYSFRILRDLMENEMKERKFFALSPGMNEYYKAEKPFGDVVFDRFPSARFDSIEAGTCLACRCNVAAGFHLMRVAEVGMREIGRDRQIPFALNETIEFKEWGLIIGQLETAVKAVQQWPNSPSKEEAHKFYNVALTELRSFNDGWRRHAAHVRPSPEMHDDDALALWGHVHRFMSKLATKIREGEYTPLVW